MLRKEKKVQKEASLHQKKPKKKETKKKQNQKKKRKKDAGVKLDKDDFLTYDQSLFSSFDAPEWLDDEQEWCVGSTYCTNYRGQSDTICFSMAA
jgi:Ni/Co efflux regulator RcnB